jgi:hypothetical protein
MKIKALAIASLLSIIGIASMAPASALEVGVTNTVSNTVTSGHLTICEESSHWDAGIQRVFNISGDVQLQVGGGGQKGIGGDVSFGNDNFGLGGSIFGDGLGYIQLSGNGEVSATAQVFVDHVTTTQQFSGTQTTSSVTTSSATFTNF